MLVTRHEPTCISVARCARIIFCSLTLSLSTCLAFFSSHNLAAVGVLAEGALGGR